MAHPADDIVSAMRGVSPKDAETVRRAYDFAEKAHGEEKRKSGEPYIVHPHAIAVTLAKLGMKVDTIVAGILHDTLEDTTTSAEDIEREFGTTARTLVEGLTKLSKLKYRGLERHVESLRRLLVATANDIRVIIVKLADRLHNMETIGYVDSPDKRTRIALETMEVYVPIAERLGIGVLKAQLEDLSFAVLKPDEHQKISTYLKNESEKAASGIEEAKKELAKALQENGIRSFRLESRVKSVHSFAKKLAKRGNDVDKVYDTFAIRVIVPTLEDCYRSLGIVHALWRPMIGRLKDYIADPKPNGYRSIQTTILTPQKIMMEIQIRSEEMNRDAQFGVASHFEYKEHEAGRPHEMMPTILWLKQFIPSLMKKRPVVPEEGASASPGWLKELNDVAENFEEHSAFQKALKEDFFAERMFTFTPGGDVIDLPVGATPIDFAYAIHSDVGNTMIGAKVNGKMTQLSVPLRNGDIVEIVTRKSARPNRKWLEYVKTSSAKHHIKNVLNRLEAERQS